jgi:glycosyltransferase involved in cell wall biosynthesis
MSHKKIKLALFHCGFIYSGGGERIVLEEAKALSQRGFSVEVYAPTLDEKKCFPEMVKDLGVKMFLPSFIDWLPLRNAIRMVASSLLAPLLAFKFTDVDVFIGANQPGAWIAFCISQVLAKPYIVYLNQPNRLLYPREVDQENGWVNEPSYAVLGRIIWALRFFMKKIDRLSIKKAQAVLANGSYIAGVIEGVYKSKVLDCPAGAKAQPSQRLAKLGEAFKGSLKLKKTLIRKPYVLLTNRHDPQKKFEYALAMMKQVKEKLSQVQLIIPGPATAHTPKLLKLVRRLGLKKQVVFLGQISEAELQGLYQQAAVYVYPAPQEDFGLGPLEAGAWAVPSVAWDNAGPTVTIENGKTGFLARPFEIDDYAEKVIRLLEDENLQFRLGRAAWRRVKDHFSWKNHVNILTREIKRVIK